MIALRYKRLTSGKYSIYLDHYDETTKKRNYRFLKLQVTKDYSKNDKVVPQDKEIMRVAMDIFNKANHKKDNINPVRKTKKLDNGLQACTELLVFLKQKILQNPGDNGNKMLLNHLGKFLHKRDIAISCITHEWIMDFQQYLSEKLSQSTFLNMLFCLKWHIEHAILKGIVDKNPFDGYELKIIPKEERPFLTTRECLKLANTPTGFNPQIRDAFFFALHSGLRWVDIKYLRQKQVTISGEKGREQFFLTLLHLKNGGAYTIELEKGAIEILKGYLNHKDGLVFAKLPNKPNCNMKLHLWSAMAGINKNACFSMARNSFAMQLLKKGNTRQEARKKIGLLHTHDFQVYEKMFAKENKNR